MNVLAKLFKGRLNRKQYLLRFLAAGITFAVVGFVASSFIDFGRSSFLYPVLLFPLAVYTISLDYRRLQDLGYTGLFSLIKVTSLVFFEVAVPMGLPDTPATELLGVIVGLMSFILTIVLFFFPGQEGKNKYGPKPK